MKRLIVLLVVALAACGGDDDDDAAPPTTASTTAVEVDSDALQDSMGDFVDANEDEFGRLSPPAYDTSEEVLLGFVPEDGDPLVLCNALADFVLAQGFDGVEIRIILSLDDQTPLATGVSGQACGAV